MCRERRENILGQPYGMCSGCSMKMPTWHIRSDWQEEYWTV